MTCFPLLNLLTQCTSLISIPNSTFHNSNSQLLYNPHFAKRARLIVCRRFFSCPLIGQYQITPLCTANDIPYVNCTCTLLLLAGQHSLLSLSHIHIGYALPYSNNNFPCIETCTLLLAILYNIYTLESGFS